MNETWKDIIGFEGYYQISNFGCVKSLPRSWQIKHWQNNSLVTMTSKERLLTSSIGRRGYYSVALCKNSKTKKKYIHQLIAQAFIDNPNNYKIINHIDGNKLNNDINNLEWCTHKENMQHAFKTELSKHDKPINQYDRDGNLIKKWKSARAIYEALNFNYKNISACCRRKRPTAYGYKWRFVGDEQCNVIRINSNNKTGFNGVSQYSDTQKYRAYITINYKQLYLGVFDTPEKAVAAREAKEKEIFNKK